MYSVDGEVIGTDMWSLVSPVTITTKERRCFFYYIDFF